ncbi:UDP-glycosyltransferase 83A1-like [Henckelia pumila]|uniref:UDP-glycosyltransferase 83A1-like n=1 Tax=Henckelia pumila TaxID=405737 RepID=UPI003C6DCA9F
MGKPHVLVLPYPAQGHVIPLMELSQCLANNGIKVTFVNTEFCHRRVVESMSKKGNHMHEAIDLVSIPDGLEPWDDRSDLGKLTETLVKEMPGNLAALIGEINAKGRDEITCVVSDYWLGWSLEVAQRFGVKRVAFVPASVAMSALSVNVQKLVDDGIVDCNGTPFKKQVIELSPGMPGINTMNLAWATIGDFATQKIIFQFMKDNTKLINLAERVICNTSHELEPAALAYVPHCSAVGPLLASKRLGSTVGHFWPQDSACLDWLDQQPPCSVIYVAFGSFTVFDQTQFQELALGLEGTNRPFLWVVRKDTGKSYPEGFEQRVEDRGKIVGWAPQQKVLSHPSVSCFLSHCGWNSTMEGVSNGLRFLCWPYFADQFIDESYVCDYWRVGLRLDKDESGIITRKEIKNKVEQLLRDEIMKRRAFELQKKALDCVAEGGSSHKNFQDFVDWIKGKGSD